MPNAKIDLKKELKAFYNTSPKAPVLVDEQVVCEGEAIGTLTGDQTLVFVLEQLGPFVER